MNREEAGRVQKIRRLSTVRLWRSRFIELTVTLLFVGLILFSFLQFTGWVEGRVGQVLDDPILAILQPYDLSVPIFVLIYGALLSAIVLLRRHPDKLLHLLRAYGLLIFVRIAAMWVTPLDPPEEMILLVDPLAGVGPGGALTRDLFFSGHTATMVLLALGMVRRWERIMFGLTALLLAILLLLQHVHYTVDLLAAPFFAWGCYRLTAPRRPDHMSGPR